MQRAGFEPDYYMKTLHHDNYWSAHPRENRVEGAMIAGNKPDHNQWHDNMFDLFPEKTVEFMGTVQEALDCLQGPGGRSHPARRRLQVCV